MRDGAWGRENVIKSVLDLPGQGKTGNRGGAAGPRVQGREGGSLPSGTSDAPPLAPAADLVLYQHAQAGNGNGATLDSRQVATPTGDCRSAQREPAKTLATSILMTSVGDNGLNLGVKARGGLARAQAKSGSPP